MRLLGIDPGLRRTGWGVIRVEGSHLRHLANGTIVSDGERDLASRLVQLYEGLSEIIATWAPDAAAVEQTFVNKDPVATLKLGQARAIALLAPARAGLPVAEYAPNLVKKTVVGVGHAAKEQIRMMVGVLLPGAEIRGADAADALAVAICHAHWREGMAARLAAAAKAGRR